MLKSRVSCVYDQSTTCALPENTETKIYRHHVAIVIWRSQVKKLQCSAALQSEVGAN